MRKSNRPWCEVLCSVVAVLVALGAVVCLPAVATAETILLQDNFTSFSLGTTWQATSFGGATGVPQRLEVVDHAAATDGKSLELGSDSTLTPDEWRGIETSNAFAIAAGTTSVDLGARVEVDHDGESLASFELTLLGSSGKWASMRGTANPGAYDTGDDTTYDWVMIYADSEGNSAMSPRWHSNFEFLRDWNLAVDGNGVMATVWNPDHLTKAWDTSVSNLILSDFGTDVRVVFRQLTEPAGASSQWIRAQVDEVALTVVPEPSAATLLAVAAFAALFGWYRRR